MLLVCKIEFIPSLAFSTSSLNYHLRKSWMPWPRRNLGDNQVLYSHLIDEEAAVQSGKVPCAKLYWLLIATLICAFRTYAYWPKLNDELILCFGHKAKILLSKSILYSVSVSGQPYHFHLSIMVMLYVTVS